MQVRHGSKMRQPFANVSIFSEPALFVRHVHIKQKPERKRQTYDYAYMPPRARDGTQYTMQLYCPVASLVATAIRDKCVPWARTRERKPVECRRAAARLAC